MKIVATLLVAFLAIQTSTQSPLQDDSTTKDIVVEVINSVISLLDPILQDAKAKVADFEANEANKTAEVVSTLSGIAAQLNALILKGVTELKDGSNDAAIDCIDGQQEATDNAVTETLTLTANCISEEYSAIVGVVNQILDDLQKLEDDIQEQVNTLDACTSSDTICFLAFASTLYETLTKISEVLPTDINAIVEVVEEVVSHIDTCDLAPGIKTNAQNILDAAVSCIKSS